MNHSFIVEDPQATSRCRTGIKAPSLDNCLYFFNVSCDLLSHAHSYHILSLYSVWNLRNKNQNYNVILRTMRVYKKWPISVYGIRNNFEVYFWWEYALENIQINMWWVYSNQSWCGFKIYENVKNIQYAGIFQQIMLMICEYNSIHVHVSIELIS